MAVLKRGEPYDDGKGSASITSVHEFVKQVSQLRQAAPHDRLYFRGDGKTLIPHIGKDWYYGDRGPVRLDDREWQLLHRFRRFTNPEVNSENPLWETLFLARHHELPTRLLDWSTNPLVTLYFALGMSESNAAPKPLDPHAPEKFVWAMMLNPPAGRADIDVLDKESDPLRPESIWLARANGEKVRLDPTQDAIKIVFPVYNSARITAQRGVFTWQSKPNRALDSYFDKTLPDQNLDVERLYRWSVPNNWNTRTSLMRDLEDLGIDARAVFPELDGVCRALLHAELLYS